MSAMLEVKNLSVSFYTPRGEIQAVRDVSFELHRGEILAVVGESGCGKSVMCKSIMGLLPDIAKIRSGSIVLDGADISAYGRRQMSRLCRNKLSMVFQNPMSSLDPVMSIGAQIGEAVKMRHPEMTRRAVHARVCELMELTGIDNAEERSRMYPQSFSGGMRQRAVTAAALASEPEIIIADEPTTALDVTIQSRILKLFDDIRHKFGTSIIFVSHDLGAVAGIADRINVMYAGKIIETGTVRDIFDDPRHPYTRGLLRSLPSFNAGSGRLYEIPGMPPQLIDPPKGDAFAERNEYAMQIDYEEEPPMFRISETHSAAAWLLDERAAEAAKYYYAHTAFNDRHR